MKIAVFDVCDTLYSVNTTFSFLDDYFQNSNKYRFFRKISKLFIIKALNVVIYRLTGKDFIRLAATRFLRDHEIEAVSRYSQSFVRTVLYQQQQDTIVQLLEYYKQKGFRIVLMSGAYEFIIKEVAKFYDVDDYFASRLEIKKCRFTGRFAEDILLNKRALLEKYYDFDELIVVSDNKSDLSLMQIATMAFAVCNKAKECKFWIKHKAVKQIRVFDV